jgi:hypothetical protein
MVIICGDLVFTCLQFPPIRTCSQIDAHLRILHRKD